MAIKHIFKIHSNPVILHDRSMKKVYNGFVMKQ